MVNVNLLKSRMALRGITQVDLSNAMQITDASFRNKLSGRSDFRVKEITRCRDCLNLSDDDIIDIFFTK